MRIMVVVLDVASRNTLIWIEGSSYALIAGKGFEDT